MSKDRIIWVDNLKALGILSVILGHIQSPYGFFIFSWHMPLFFFISGFFIKFNKSIKEFITDDFKRLMIHYFLFSIFGLIIESIKRSLISSESLDYLYEFKGIFIYMDYPHLINTYGFILWFLPALFFARLLVYLLNMKIESIFIQFIIVLCLFYFSFSFDTFFGIDNSLNSIIFIFLGTIYYRLYQNEKILYLLLFILPVLILYFGVPALNMASKDYENIFINVSYAISIIFILVKLLQKMKYENRLVRLWGENTMLLFIIHPYTNHIGHIFFGNEVLFGNWHLKLIVSLVILQCVLYVKLKFINRGIFKYV